MLAFAIHGDILGLDGLGQPQHTTGAVALEDSSVVALPFQQLLTLSRTVPALEALPNWTEEALHDTLIGLAEQNGMKNGTMLWPVRIALAGKQVTPGGAIEIAALLGREESLRRLNFGRSKI